MKALLLSGGMDSIALAYWLRPDVAITVDYGQVPAEAEIRASISVCEALQIRHYVIHANLKELGSGDLAGVSASPLNTATEWWPFRNQMLVTLAAMRCVTLGVSELLIGTLLTDCFHRDGTVEFITKLNDLVSFQEGALVVRAPAINLTPAELLRESKVPEEIIGWAHSCHRANFACGTCRGCEKHYRTLEGLNRAAY